MSDVVSVRLRWRVPKALQPVFYAADTLPTTDDVALGHFGTLAKPDKIHLGWVITDLRSELEYNIMRQQTLDVGELSSDDPNWDFLTTRLDALLRDMEHLIGNKIFLESGVQLSMQPDHLSCFPRIVALWEALEYRQIPQAGNNLSEDNASDISNATNPSAPDSARTESISSPRYSPQSVRELSEHILFPRDPKMIENLHMSTSDFQLAMKQISEGSAADWESEAQTDDITPGDIEVIQHAHRFASTCTSLFTQMANNPTCGTPHRAKLHLSGFKQDRLQMSIETCKETDWISAIFKRSLDRPSSPKVFHLHQICSTASSDNERSDVLHVAFNSEIMWVDDTEGGLKSPSIAEGEESLSYHLTHERRLALKYRKLASVLLAASVFQLSNSPWIEQDLEPERIFLPPPNDKHLQQWCPRIHCTLVSRQDRRLQSDKIAALGVLIMELEANRKADWAPEDKNYLCRERSNLSCLTRILEDWQNEVTDDYRQIAKACLEFNSLVENLTQPDIAADRKGLAIIYKYILQPLFDRLADGFQGLTPLFEDMFGPGHSLVSPVSKPSAATEKPILFDDDDATPSDKDQTASNKFLQDLKPFFSYIKNIRPPKPQLVQKQHPRIRIAVLDSGVDESVSMIRQAIDKHRINNTKSKSFVGRTNSWRQDSHGHGSQVAQLLLQTAPTAEIYVGKICTGKTIETGYMQGISEAIDWATDECDAHIISISFAYEEDDALIDKALAKAIHRGKLIIAAASNNGGLRGRARPARREGVICIHATDGLGNKGKMNPSPLGRGDKFATLGVAVPLRWKGDKVYKSGTSYAVPIAVGFAVAVLEFAMHRCHSIAPNKSKVLYEKRGIEAVFRKIVEPRDGYDFIYPTRIWEDWGDVDADAQTARTIEEAVRYL